MENHDYEEDFVNPWYIESTNDGYRLDIRIINNNTGEIREIKLDANDINVLHRKENNDRN